MNNQKSDVTAKGAILVTLIVILFAWVGFSQCGCGIKGIETNKSTETNETTDTTVTGDNATIYNMDFNGWTGMAGFLLLGKMFFIRKNHVATKALDRVVEAIERNTSHPATGHLKKDIHNAGLRKPPMQQHARPTIPDSQEKLICSRLAKLFPKEKKP